MTFFIFPRETSNYRIYPEAKFYQQVKELRVWPIEREDVAEFTFIED